MLSDISGNFAVRGMDEPGKRNVGMKFSRLALYPGGRQSSFDSASNEFEFIRQFSPCPKLIRALSGWKKANTGDGEIKRGGLQACERCGDIALLTPVDRANIPDCHMKILGGSPAGSGDPMRDRHELLPDSVGKFNCDKQLFHQHISSVPDAEVEQLEAIPLQQLLQFCLQFG